MTVFKNPTDAALVADVTKFLIILHSTCIEQFSLGVDVLLFFVPLVLICRMHLNIYGGSFHFLYIMLLFPDVMHCNLKIEWFFATSIFVFDCTVVIQYYILNIVGTTTLA